MKILKYRKQLLKKLKMLLSVVFLLPPKLLEMPVMRKRLKKLRLKSEIERALMKELLKNYQERIKMRELKKKVRLEKKRLQKPQKWKRGLRSGLRQLERLCVPEEMRETHKEKLKEKPEPLELKHKLVFLLA